MSKLQWKSLTSHEGSPFLTWLHESTHEGLAVIRGIGEFITVRIPQLCRAWFGSLADLALFACRTGYHLSRFIGVVLAWLGILLAPLFIHPGWITVIWLLIALSGTVWAVDRLGRNKARAAAAKKGGFNA